MHECCFQKDFLSPANRSDLEREWMRPAAYALGCRKESLAVQERYGILPVVYQETKTRKIEGGRGM